MVQVSQLFCDIWIARYFAHKVSFTKSRVVPAQSRIACLKCDCTAGMTTSLPTMLKAQMASKARAACKQGLCCPV